MLLLRLHILAALFLPAEDAIRHHAEVRQQAAEDVQVLKAARVPADGPGLVRFLQQQVLTAADEQRVGELVGRLADRRFKVRDQAATELLGRGPAVLPLLRRAPKAAELEAQRRLQRCIDTLEKTPWGKVGAAAARRLKELRPQGACGGLLAFLPFGGEEAEEEILTALLTVGVRDGKPDPAFLPALRDPAPSRRAAAALCLGRLGDAKQREAVRALMRAELYLSVRLRAAEGLLDRGDPSPVPVLLAVLGEGSPELARWAEELLLLLAGAKGPTVPLGESVAERAKAHAAWSDWWDTQRGHLRLPRGGVAALRSNPFRVARKTAERFLRAIFPSPNLVEFRKTTDVPFAIYNDKTLQTRADLDAFFKQQLDAGKQDLRGLKVTVSRVLRPHEYEKTLGPNKRGEEEFLRARQSTGLLIVQVQVSDGREKQELLALYVRVRGAEARVIAIGGDP
jgi:HEAT repeat protein